MSLEFLDGGVRVEDVSYWFSECWFWSKSLSSPVYVRSVFTRDRDRVPTVECQDILGKFLQVPLEDLEIRVPELGYCLNTGQGRNSAVYLFNVGQRSYKKGLHSSRVYSIRQRFLPTRDGKLKPAVARVPVGGAFWSNRAFITSVFSPNYCCMEEALAQINDGVSSSVALSRDFAVSSSEFYGNGVPYQLMMRGLFVSEVDKKGRVLLKEPASYLHQKIEGEIQNVQIVGA